MRPTEGSEGNEEMEGKNWCGGWNQRPADGGVALSAPSGFRFPAFASVKKFISSYSCGETTRGSRTRFVSQAVPRVTTTPIKVYQGQKISVPIVFAQNSLVTSHLGKV